MHVCSARPPVRNGCYFRFWMSDPRNMPPRAWINARRSQRVVARVRVQVKRRKDGDDSTSEVSYTLVVNAHGALIHLVMKVEKNEVLAIKNWNTAEERQSRVVQIGGEAGRNEVAIEFTEPAPSFWRIDFPPPDWKRLED